MKKLIALIALAILMSGCVSPGGTTTAPGATVIGSNTIVIKDFSFTDNMFHVTRGTTVTWANMDNVTHTVTSGYVMDGNKVPDGMFGSGDITPGGTWSYTFQRDGVYRYYCDYHPGMQGEVIVAEEGETVMDGEMVTHMHEVMMHDEESGLIEMQTPHFESSYPSHMDELETAPEPITLTFNYPVIDGSYINVYSGVPEMHHLHMGGGLQISGDGLSMSEAFSDLGEGTFRVEYKAVWLGGTYHFGEFYFTVGREEPTVTVSSFKPSYGITGGGTPITIRGSGFQPGAKAWFHHLYAQSTEYIDSNTLRVVTPRHFADTIEVRIDNPDGSYGSGCCFTFR